MRHYIKTMTAEYLRSIMAYDPKYGIFSWRERASAPKSWNTRRSGKDAGYSCEDPRCIQIRIDKRLYLAHRLAWLYVHGEWPETDIDHINGNPYDNRLANLRLATHVENMRNRGAQANGNSGYKGVTFDKQTQRWRAKIKANGIHHHLGRFDTAEEAAAAYREAAIRLHGAFARF